MNITWKIKEEKKSDTLHKKKNHLRKGRALSPSLSLWAS